MKVESNNVVIDAISLYWKIAKHVGPKDRDDIFYTSFAVSLLTVTQLTLVVFVAGSLGYSIIDRVSSGLVTALILVLAAILAGVNSMIIFNIDKRKSRVNIGSQRRFVAFVIIVVYFALAITCAIKIFAWRAGSSVVTVKRAINSDQL